MSTATSGHAGRVIYTGLTAAGSNQATALRLAGRATRSKKITTVASSTGVLLPPIILPMRVEIANQGANASRSTRSLAARSTTGPPTRRSRSQPASRRRTRRRA